ncbi:MAG: hypothetical protein Q4B63_05215 [Clostridium perfringens]|nr:hypothetical protein [Clostridium perfringens]
MKDFSKEAFYESLTSKTIREVTSILKLKKLINIFKFIEYLLYTLSAILLVTTLPSFFNEFSIDNLLSLIILFLAIYFILPMVKTPQENFITMTDNLRDSLNKYTCTCTKECSCKEDLKLYLKKKGIHLL